MNDVKNAGYGSIAELIEARQNELGTTDHQVDVALGHTHKKVEEMIKKGSMRLPLNKVVELAGVLDVDAASLPRLTLSETDVELLFTIERAMGPVQPRFGLRHAPATQSGAERWDHFAFLCPE